MAKAIVTRKRVVRRGWTRAEVKELRQHSKDKTRKNHLESAQAHPRRAQTKSPYAQYPAWSSPHDKEASKYDTLVNNAPKHEELMQKWKWAATTSIAGSVSSFRSTTRLARN